MNMPDATTLNAWNGLISTGITAVMTVLGFVFGHKHGKNSVQKNGEQAPAADEKKI